eukprot:6388707-Pyramimonas_sp.AAC.1
MTLCGRKVGEGRKAPASRAAAAWRGVEAPAKTPCSVCPPLACLCRLRDMRIHRYQCHPARGWRSR